MTINKNFANFLKKINDVLFNYNTTDYFIDI